MDWQPINTAPKDEDIWLLGCVAGSKLPAPMSYDPDDGWFPLNGIFKNWKPTHWMPIPTPPKLE
jgi:hypothetical protein